jgi:hypothetical protein
LSRDDILGYFRDDEFQDSLLVFDLLLMDEDDSSLFVVVQPFILPYWMAVLA